jgi:hypothetical protein
MNAGRVDARSDARAHARADAREERLSRATAVQRREVGAASNARTPIWWAPEPSFFERFPGRAVARWASRRVAGKLL